METADEPASSLISPIRVRSRFHATGLLYHDLNRTAEGLFFGDLNPGSTSQNRVAIRIADGEILDPSETPGEREKRGQSSQVSSIAIDETSSRRGRCYVSVFLDAQTHRLLYVAEGRTGLAVEQFAQALMARGGDLHHIKWVAMDTLHCYAKGVREQFPQAQIVYDRYHLMVMAGEAVDEVRRSLQRQVAQLKGALWSLRGNPWNLDAEQQQTRIRLAKQYKPIGRALALQDL